MMHLKKALLIFFVFNVFIAHPDNHTSHFTTHITLGQKSHPKNGIIALFLGIVSWFKFSHKKRPAPPTQSPHSSQTPDDDTRPVLLPCHEIGFPRISFQTSFDQLPKYTTQHTLLEDAQELLRCDHKSFQEFHGNETQQKLHTELVSIVNEAAKLYRESSIPEVKTFSLSSIECANISREFNAIGQTEKAIAFSNSSWSLLNCAQAIAKGCAQIGLGVGEGIIKGTLNTAHSITHPVEFVQNIGKAVETAGYYLGKALYLVAIAPDSDLALIAPEYYAEQCEKFGENFEGLNAFIEKIERHLKDSSLRDTAREITALGIEAYLTGKAIGATKQICKQGSQAIEKLAEKLAKTDPELFGVTPEMLKPNLAQSTSKTISNLMQGSSKNIPSSANNMENIIHYIKNGNTIKKFTNQTTTKYSEHIFSEKHIADGIMKLGSTQEDILQKFVCLIRQTDALLLLKSGSNQIQTTINGEKTIIRFFIDNNGQVLSLNGFLENGKNVNLLGNIINI